MLFALVASMVVSVAVLATLWLLIDPQVATSAPQVQVTAAVTSTPGQLTVTAPPPDMDSVCDQLAATFNSINNILPMSITFNAGEAVGITYPPGKIILNSEARKLDGCVSYQLAGSSAIMVHLEVLENLEIQFPRYAINGQNWTISLKLEGCQFVLHYNILPRVESGGRQSVNMSALMGELKTLGNVTLNTDMPGMDGRDFTREAEDIVRPRLFEAFNLFAKEELQWIVDLSGMDSSLDGLTAFKLIFKRQMIQVGNAYKK